MKNMTNIKAMNKRTVALFGAMFLFLSLLFSTVAPVISYAEGSGFSFGDGGLTIQLDESGGVKVDGEDLSENRSDAWNNILEKYQGFISGISAILTATMVVLFMINFMKLGASVGNPQARSQALMGCLWTGIAAACLGSVTVIVGFFYKAI